MEIDVLDKDSFLSSLQKEIIIDDAKRILSFLNQSNKTELSISIVGDIEMREFNNRYRNIDRTTDILSFSQQSSHMLGDLIISYETTLRHSKKYKITLENEFRKLLVHGILHLLGYDHKKKKERDLMREKEKKILTHFI